ncbi:MAG: hypothetical protein M3177_03640 [Pseudomonadota bacterium]|nr:hypothetical protein [Pseudomonadota bacterium]
MAEELAGIAGPHSSSVPVTEQAASPAATQVECAFCAELISSRAKKCRHCGETLDVPLRRAEEALRASERSPNVYMNAGGGGAAAAASGSGANVLRPFNHLLHILLSVITIGWWIPVYLLLYIFRNKNFYY